MRKAKTSKEFPMYFEGFKNRFCKENIAKAESVLDEMFGSVAKEASQNNLPFEVFAVAFVNRSINSYEASAERVSNFADDEINMITKELFSTSCFSALANSRSTVEIP